ncbi:STAS domain-containing protein [Bacillus infantis]|uniref:STAS domain-containing protein n=1 Tax=Bacillus infantis TaxID=324767 RepID=UPI001CD6105A|nr:STAS domain-containing protein [Bacillus infantis]MCA1042013.1 STAS domain-containing protein [Bacillus infantis]
MKHYINNLLDRNHSELFELWKKEVSKGPPKRQFQEESRLLKELYEFIFNSLKNIDTDEIHDLNFLYQNLLDYRGSFEFVTYGFQSFRRVALQIMVEEDLPGRQIVSIYNQIDRWFDPILIQLLSDCSHSWEETFNSQEETMRELSAPFIPLLEHIAVMPLVGEMTEQRSASFMENLLEGITKNQTDLIFFDISAVPIVDTYSAQVIIDVTKAAGLLGADCMIVGVRPEIAQTMIGLGINLSTIRTFSSLHNGLIYALRGKG